MRLLHTLSFICGLFLIPAVNAANLLRDPSFENETTDKIRPAAFRYDRQTKQIIPQPRDIAYSERDSSFSRSGKRSMLFAANDSGITNEINYQEFMPCEAGRDYLFGFHYFIAAADARISGRIAFFDENRKLLKNIFPEVATKESGKWLGLKYNFVPPAGAKFMQFTLWFSGKGKIYLDDIFLGRPAPETTRNRPSPILLTGNDAFTFWQENAWSKVPRRNAPAKFRTQPPAEIVAAANESEPFQLVVSPRRQMRNVALQFGEFRSDDGTLLPSGVFKYLTVGYIKLKKSANERMRTTHADPLLHEQKIDIAPGENQPFYVVATLPSAQRPGIYKGKVRLQENGRTIAETSMQLRVRSFALPEIPALQTWFLFTLGSPGNYRGNDPRPSADIFDDMYTQYRQHHFTGNQAEYLPRPAVQITGDSLRITDWSKFDARVAELRDQYGFRIFPVPYLGMMGDYFGWFTADRKIGNAPFGKYPLLSPQGLKLTADYARQFVAHVTAKFPELTFFAYIYDEPTGKIRAEVKTFADYLHKAAPGLKIFIPMEVTDEAGYVHTWCVPFSEVYVDWDKQQSKIAAGHGVWYYNWRAQLDDTQYIKNRLFAWQIYAADGSGGLLWHSAFAPNGVNPWHDLDKTGEDGAATIFYPPRRAGDKISPSMRSMQFAEAIDDFSYLKLLEQKINAKFPGHGKNRIKEIIRELLPDLKFTFVSDPELLYRLRNKIADEIENFEHKFPALLLTTPRDNSETELNEVRARLFAPAGATFAVNGKTSGTISGSQETAFSILLEQNGPNTISIKVEYNGKVRELKRTVIRKEDVRLQELKKLQQLYPAREISDFLVKIAAQKSYTAADQKQAQELLTKYQTCYLASELKKYQNAPNALTSMLRQRAEWMLANRLTGRAAYYLPLCRATAQAGDMSSRPVKAEPVNFHGLPGVKLSNGLIAATILECGGRLVSFKVGGVETLADGGMKGLSELERAKQTVNTKMVTFLRNSTGIEGAGGETLWPISFVDWDWDFREISPDKITLSSETVLPGGMFRLRKTVTMRQNSADLLLDYSISNILPADYISDNPGHYDLEWRLRLLPAIGDGNQPRRNDVLFVSGTPKLPENAVNAGRIRFERPAIALDQPYVGAYDQLSGKGFALLFDRRLITHAYVWFDTWQAQHELYTLELPRMNFLNSADTKTPNRPFSILPGRTVNFQIKVRGLENITDHASFSAAATR